MLAHTHDISHRERRITHSLIAFAIAAVLSVLLWLAFARYL